MGSVRSALVEASRSGFRVLQLSVQSDHVHLLLEADSPTGFDRGVRGLAVRMAKAVNRALGRHGGVWADRYHARLLRTPLEVRNALVYVLNNFHKHIARSRRMDPCSRRDGSRVGGLVPPGSIGLRCLVLARGWQTSDGGGAG